MAGVEADWGLQPIATTPKSGAAKVGPAGSRKALEAQKAKFTTPDSLNVHVTTYNANGKPTGESMSDILDEGEQPPDIYAFGLQEIVEFNVGTVMLYDTDSCLKWEQHLTAELTRKHGAGAFVALERVHLVGTALIVFVQAARHAQVKEVATSTVGCGILGTMGNKGGVGIRFELNGLKLAITSCHLNSGQEKLNRRNQDSRDIMQRLAFGDNQLPLRSHDVVLWCGDLNYRIELPADELIELMKAGAAVKPENWIQLAEDSDQLLLSKQKELAFVGWQEAPITFVPTYKYINGTDQHDPKRAPAWTDRVMWKGEGQYAQRVECNWYGRHELLDSDHKPVTALFSIDHEIVDLAKQAEVLAGIMREQDAWENDLIPQISLAKTSLEFDEVAYLEQREETFTIVNDGLTLVAFEFVPRGSVDASVSLPFYSVHPLKGSLAPGASCEISVSLRVTEESVHVAHASPSLEDIVVLHLENGRDYFITLNGSMKPTLFGRSLEELCSRLPADMEEGPGATASLPVPSQLWKLVDTLNNRISEAAASNWFLEGGDEVEMAQIREAMSHDGELDGFGTTSLAHSLVSFLEALPEAIIPDEVAAQLQIKHVASSVEEQKIMGYLTTPHYNTFIYVMAFLRELLERSKDTSSSLLTAESLAFVFANCMCRSAAKKDSPTSPRARQNTKVNGGLVQFLLRFL